MTHENFLSKSEAQDYLPLISRSNSHESPQDLEARNCIYNAIVLHYINAHQYQFWQAVTMNMCYHWEGMNN